MKKKAKKARKKAKKIQKKCGHPFVDLFAVMMLVIAFGFLGAMSVRYYTHKVSTNMTTSQPEQLVENIEPLVAVETLEHLEMLNVIIHVAEPYNSGSGTLISREELIEGLYGYLVLTNAHVVADRYADVIDQVDGLRGIIGYTPEDLGCDVTVFSNQATEWNTYDAEIIAEAVHEDLALVYFITEDCIENIALLATPEMLKEIKIFDEIYAVGCQLGKRPIPTRGIVSGIYNSDKWKGFSHTAQIAPGSSGGGLFKKCCGHYYLIGVPSMVEGYFYQLLPHYGYSISLETVYEFFVDNNISLIVVEEEVSETIEDNAS